MTITTDWINEHYTFGWYVRDNGDIFPFERPALDEAPFDPIDHDGDVPIYAPLRQRLLDHGELVAICRTCGEPAFHVSRHMAEKHAVGETVPASASQQRPEWFAPHWI